MRVWLRELREDKTQLAMAQTLGIVQGYYSAIENGNKTPHINKAKKFARILGVDWTLFYEDKDGSKEQAS